MMSKRHSRLSHTIMAEIARAQKGACETVAYWTYDGSERLSKADYRMLKDALCLWTLSTLDLVDLESDSQALITGFTSIDKIKRAFINGMVQFISDNNFRLDWVQTSLKAHVDSIRRDYGTINDVIQYVFDYCLSFRDFAYEVCLAVMWDGLKWYKIMHHVFSFLGKMPSNPQSTKMDDDAVRAFVETEAELPVAESFDPDLIRKMRRICEGWFALYRGSGRKVFGPGSTADAGRNPAKKVEALGYYPGCEHLIRQNLDLEDIEYLESKGTIDVTSKLLTVPKNALKKRTICMEPATLSLVQEGVFRSMEEIFKVSEMRYHVFLDNQELMRLKCQAASNDGSFATLDLSAASDSILKELPLLILPARVALDILATRTPQCRLPDGRILPLRKFCSMGSKVCFPLECTIFCVVCETVCRDLGMSADERHDAYMVFGDDMIVRKDLVDRVISVLEHLGFKVNKDKSFFNPKVSEDQMCFRESCGIFCLNGEDISTPTLSRFFTAVSQDMETPETAAMKIGLANRFLLAGMYSARLYVINSLRTKKGDLYWPFVEFQTSFLTPKGFGDWDKTYWSQYGLWSLEHPSNYHLKRRSARKAPRFPRAVY